MKRLAFVAALVATSSAWAQSKKYPPEPVDRDEEEERKSLLWEHATNPHQRPYRTLVKDAESLIAERTRDGLLAAVAKLDEAIKLVPGGAEAYLVRGEARMQLQDWGECASDLHAAWTRVRLDLDVKATAELRLKLGLCQARDGKLADAERTLTEAAATGVNSTEIWMRLGEVRIAMGKLEEAISALESAIEQTDRTAQALPRWLLAGAYDRARRPSEAKKTASDALAVDRNLMTLRSPTLPLLGVAESDYLLGLAYESFPLETPRPEHALVYFRRFLEIAVDSPWRRRAEDHVRELRTAQLPDAIDRTSGNAALDEKAARTAVRKSMPAMRGCLAKLPYVVMRVTVTKAGPRSRDAVERTRRYSAPPGGVSVEIDESLDDASRATIDGARRCVEPLVERVALPSVKEKDAYYKIVFRVVSP